MAVIFTDQYVHFSASDTLAPEITSSYGHGESGRASIPLPHITKIAEAGGDVIVNVEERGSLLLTDFWTAGADVGKMQAHLAEAREIAAARD